MAKYGKIVALLVVAALAFSMVALSGCSQPTPTASTPATSTTPAEKPTVKTVEAGKLIAGSDTAFPPFESMEGNTAVGFDVDIVAAVAKEIGLTSEFKSYKFDTLIPTLKAGGKFDIIASGMTINADRKKEIDFSDPYIDSNQSISVKNDSTVKSAADLAGKKIGVQSGTTGEDWTKSNIPTAQRVPFKTATEAFAALQAGNVDAVINDLPVTVEIVKDKARGLVIVKEVATGEQYGFAVSKDNPDLLKAINDGLAKVKASGEYKTLYDKYFSAQ